MYYTASRGGLQGGFAKKRITSPSLLRNATSPTEGRPWHSAKLCLFARGSPTRGAGERSETERLDEGEPDREPLLDSTSPSLLRNATARVAAPSVCCAVARILLAAAPTATPCFRRWRRSSPLPPEGEPLAGRATFDWTPKARYGAKGRALLTGTAASGQAHLVKLSLA